MVRRSDNEMKRNAEVGLITKSSQLDRRGVAEAWVWKLRY